MLEPPGKPLVRYRFQMKPNHLANSLKRIASYIESAPSPSRGKVLAKMAKLLSAAEGGPGAPVYGVVEHGVDMSPEEAGKKAAAMLTAGGFPCSSYDLQEAGDNWSAWLFQLPPEFQTELEMTGEWTSNDDEIMITIEAP